MNTKLIEEIFILGLMCKYHLDDLQIEEPSVFERKIVTDPKLPEEQAQEVKNFFINYWPAVYTVKVITEEGEL